MAAFLFVAMTFVGILLALTWPRCWHISACRHRWAMALLVATTGTIAYGARRDRAIEPLEPRPTLSATRPVPVLWVVIDTLRADTLYGPALTLPLAPQLRRFAESALLFRDAESAAGWTVPSVATLLTGVQPSAHQARGYLPTWAPTFAEHVHRAGYATHAVIDNGLLEPRTGYVRGFETFFQKSSMRFAHALPGFRLLGSWVRRKLRERWPSYYGAERLTDAALAQLTASTDAPPFLYVHYMDPHYPYYAHPELGPDPAGLVPVSLPQATLRRQGGVLHPEQLAFLRHRYERELAYLDGHLGRLLDEWQRRFGDESIVLVTADHGEEFLEHGWLGHVRNLHTELVRIPLLLRLPASIGVQQAGRVVDAPVNQVDLVPTMLEVLGVAPSPQTLAPHGRSWLAWLRGTEPAPTRPLLAWQDYMGVQLTRWREGPWVLIERLDNTTGKASATLFDKREDDAELHDLAGRAPERRASMAARAHAVFAEQAALSRLPNHAQSDDEALRALGYIR